MRSLRSVFFVIPVGLMVLLVLDLALHTALVGEITEGSSVFQSSDFSSLLATDRYAALRPNLKIECISPAKSFLVETNGLGMRMSEVSVQKQPNTIRVAIMGDSIAFGWGLPVNEAFPAKLETFLNRDGKTQFSVLNFAAPGFTTFHAVTQYERLVSDFQPDVLILAFGLYDSYESRLSEEELYTFLEKQGTFTEKRGLRGFMSSHSTAGRWLSKRKKEKNEKVIQSSIDDRVRGNEWKSKVDPDSIKKNLSSIIERQQKRGGKTILVNDNLFNFDSIDALRDLADRIKIPLLDIRAIFDGIGGYEELKTHFAIGLETAGEDYFEDGAKTTYLFRAQDAERTPEKGLFICGNLPELGNDVPNTARMYDDGSHGDERAGDKIWSLQITLPSPKPIRFTFTDHGVQGHWGENESGFEHDSRNQQFVFHFTPTDSERFVHWRSPVYKLNRPSFDYLLLAPNSPFPNADGHTTIAQRLATLVREGVGEKK